MTVTYCIGATASGVSAASDAVSAAARRDCASGNRASGNRASPADLSKGWKKEEKQSAVSRARQ